VTSAISLHIVGLGCARNDVDAEELAARFAAAGFDLTASPDDAQIVVVNTCGFIEAAKQDSIDQLLAAAELRQSGQAQVVVATGCLAQRYGRDLAEAMPEVDAVIGFGGYENIAATVRGLLAGRPAASRPRSGRQLSLTPAGPPPPRPLPPGPPSQPLPPGPASGPPILRRRLSDAPTAPLKIASGCDRRCAFCAIPSFRGRLVSRPPAEIAAEAAWLRQAGAVELYLVSENTTSYGKDLALADGLPRLLADLSRIEPPGWLRLSYLQPAELKDSLIAAVAETPQAVPYFDVPFQHAAAPVLKRMRRFGQGDSFLSLLERIRRACPGAGIRSNVIVGFPGETAADLAALADFLAAADLDAIGVFGYSDEEGTAAASLDGHLDEAEIVARVDDIADLADVLMAEQARRRVGQTVDVLVEGFEEGRWRGRAAWQGPESDGETWLESGGPGLAVGTLVRARVTAAEGVDLTAAPLGGGGGTP
jgi:ribosomal protein S12 methylthiotransferase RimO